MQLPHTGFDDTAKEEIRGRISIATLVERYVKLKPAGQNLKGLCPFHKEKSPSFIVSPNRGTFHCFGCGKGGDIFTFVQEMEGIDFRDALVLLAEEARVKLKTSHAPSGPAQPSNFPAKAEMLAIHQQASRFFYQQIKGNERAISYFKQRGLKPETIRDFALGYAPKGWSSFMTYAKGKGIAPQVLVACGLAVQKGEGEPYDRFRDRIMFTLCDAAGRPIAFAGRAMDDEAQPKYLNSPETPIYHKSKILYGLHKAQPSIRQSDSVIIVEGYMDYLALYECGVQNVVATAGTALTPAHAEIIKRFTQRVFLVFDGDNAGIQAAERGVFALAPYSLVVKVVILPGDEDPDSLVRTAGAEAFLQHLEQAQDGLAFLLDRATAGRDITSPQGKSAVLEQLRPYLEALSDDIVRAESVKVVSERLDVAERLIQGRLRTAAGPAQTPARGAAEPPAVQAPPRYGATLEGAFIRLILNNPKLIPQALQFVHPSTFTDRFSDHLYSVIIATYERDAGLAGLLDAMHDAEAKRVVASLSAEGVPPQEEAEAELTHTMIELQKKLLRSKLREATQQLRKAPRDRALLQRQKDLSLQLNELKTGQT
jgi:DNA primase